MGEFEIVNNDKEVLVKIKSDMVASLIEEIKPKLIKHSSESRKIVFDLDDVNMIDSIGIGFLVATHNSMVKMGQSIEVINITPEILELFKSMRLDSHFVLKGI